MPIATAAPPSAGLLLLTFIGGVILAAVILVPLLSRTARRSSHRQPAPKHARTRPRVPATTSSSSTAVASSTAVRSTSTSSTSTGADDATDPATSSAPVDGTTVEESDRVEESDSAERDSTPPDNDARPVPQSGADSSYVVVAPTVNERFRQRQTAKFGRFRTRVDRAKAELTGNNGQEIEPPTGS